MRYARQTLKLLGLQVQRRSQGKSVQYIVRSRHSVAVRTIKSPATIGSSRPVWEPLFARRWWGLLCGESGANLRGELVVASFSGFVRGHASSQHIVDD